MIWEDLGALRGSWRIWEDLGGFDKIFDELGGSGGT